LLRTHNPKDSDPSPTKKGTQKWLFSFDIPAFWCAGDYQSDNHFKTPPHIANSPAIELFIPYVLVFLRAHRGANS
jgi:hypothetical protein